MSTIWYSRKLALELDFHHWYIGMGGPYGGMIVWSFSLGPLVLRYWPRAGKLDEAPF